jgi:cation transport regulator ChaC
MAHLDYREKGGYTMKEVLVTVPGLGGSVAALVYTGTPASEEWVGGSETVEDIAQVIATAHGPSGPNCVYLFNLAEAIAAIAPAETDLHLATLVTRVTELQSLSSPVAHAPASSLQP